MKVLVTGISGFTASHLAKALLQRGYEVHGFSRPSSNVQSLERLGIHVHRGTFTEAAAIGNAVRDMDAVYHIAASYRNAGAPDSEYYEVNVEGTRRVMEAALTHGVKRVVHCSTVGVHGHVQKEPADETTPFSPGDLYQRSKLEGEELVWDYIKKGLPVSIVRPSGIYGPGDTRFLKLFKTIRNGTFVMFGDGNVAYQMIYIDDLVRGMIACGENEKALGQIFIIAGDKAITLNDLVKKIAQILGVREPRLRLPFAVLWTASVLCEAICKPLRLNPPLFRRRAQFFRKARAFDASKIERMLGFKWEVGLEDGLRRTAEWYEKEGLI